MNILEWLKRWRERPMYLSRLHRALDVREFRDHGHGHSPEWPLAGIANPPPPLGGRPPPPPPPPPRAIRCPPRDGVKVRQSPLQHYLEVTQILLDSGWTGDERALWWHRNNTGVNAPPIVALFFDMGMIVESVARRDAAERQQSTEAS